jgi:integrase
VGHARARKIPAQLVEDYQLRHERVAGIDIAKAKADVPRRYSLLVLLGAGAGLRQGEAFGLAVSQVDAVAGMITVSQQVIVVDRHPVLAPPKTSASVRDVPMPQFLQDAIARHVSDLALTDGGVLCLTPKQTLLRRDYYNREIWKPALGQAGLPADTTFHDLRHYADGWVMCPAVAFPLAGAAELVLQSA